MGKQTKPIIAKTEERAVSACVCEGDIVHSRRGQMDPFNIRMGIKMGFNTLV